MKRILNPVILIIFIFVLLCSCIAGNKKDDNEIIYPLLSPITGTVYNNGLNYFDITASPRDIKQKSLVIDQVIDIDTVRAYHGDERFTYFKILETELKVQEDDAQPFFKKVYLLTFPEYNEKENITLTYAVSGIEWHPSIEVELMSEETAMLYYYGIVESSSYSISNCDLTLVYNKSSNKLSTEADRFPIGKINLNPDEKIIYTLKNAEAPYSIEHYWYASRSKYVSKIMLIKNSFNSILYGVPYSLLNNRMVLADGTFYVDNASEDLQIEIATENRFKTYRSIITKEDKKNEEQPFTHILDFSLINQLTETTDLKVLVQREYGSKHRNIYYYKKKPDEMPGDFMVWNFTAKAGEQKDIHFYFISESKDSQAYSSYDYYEGGR